MKIRILHGIMFLMVLSTLRTSSARADNTPTAVPDTGIKELMVRDLAGARGKEIRVITVDYPAGDASPPHRHDAQVFVYVLEGTVRMQIEGSAPVVLHAGQTFYEGPKDVHVVSANASETMPARMLVFIVKDKRKPLFSAPTSEGHP
jgi:quercetin dioxygenase-like cupin family protein